MKDLKTPHPEGRTQRRPNLLKGPAVVDVDPASTKETPASCKISPSNVSTTQTPCPTPHKPAGPIIGAEDAAAVSDHDLLQQPVQTNLRKTKRQTLPIKPPIKMRKLKKETNQRRKQNQD